MNINASIVDQRLAGIQDEIKDRAAAELNIHDAGRLKSLAFVHLCVKTMLDLDVDESFDCLTEGGGANGEQLLIKNTIATKTTYRFFLLLYRNR